MRTDRRWLSASSNVDCGGRSVELGNASLLPLVYGFMKWSSHAVLVAD